MGGAANGGGGDVGQAGMVAGAWSSDEISDGHGGGRLAEALERRRN